MTHQTITDLNTIHETLAQRIYELENFGPSDMDEITALKALHGSVEALLK